MWQKVAVVAGAGFPGDTRGGLVSLSPVIRSPLRRPGIDVLRWLIRQRWLAVAGQATAIMVAVVGFGLRFEMMPLVGGLVALALSNHFVVPDFIRPRGIGVRLGQVLAFDVGILTWMLHWTGGSGNPFVLCYLLHVVLAAMLLEGRGLLGIGLLSAAGYAWVVGFSEPFAETSRWVIDGRLAPALATTGMSVALLIIGGILAVLVFAMRAELHAGERELRETSRQLAGMERFKSLATLAAGVAHELGTPLGTIAVAAKELERGLSFGRLPPDAAQDAELIRREVERCRDILRRLDRQSTGGTGSGHEFLTLGDVPTRLAERLSPEQAARLRTHCPVPEKEVRLPIEAVLQGLVVLIENACEADAGGRPVSLDIDCPDGSLRFRVQDRGPGISDEVRRRAGEPYFTTKPDHGRGLGLFLVRTLTLELGGEVSLVRVADGGTCASLHLPLEKDDFSDDPTHSPRR